MELKKVTLPFKVNKPVLSLGAQTKNTLCFLKDSAAFLSPVHADLDSPGDFLEFQIAARHFLKKKPKIIAYDLHPEYQSTKFAHGLSPNTHHPTPIQHHHAHIASGMAENGLKNQKVIGVAFDGTGLGADNTLWGAEFLLCDYRDFKRSAHLKEIPLLGAEKAIIEPWRLSAAWLYKIYKDSFLNLNIGWAGKIDKDAWPVLKKMYLSGFNSPLASSMGRLFDAAASIISERQKVDFEAELAMELEKLACNFQGSQPQAGPPMAEGFRVQGSDGSYEFNITKSNHGYIIDPQPVFKGIVNDLKENLVKGRIAFKFHLTVAQMIKKTCLTLRKESKIDKVVLSGGVFQNKLLLGLSKDLLSKDKFKVFTHRSLSCNDSGLSLGQGVIANFKQR